MLRAGEMEQPYSLSLQLDSLRSGSISFGRFERESLSWERHSSFSHNRYLEEVEKFSTPGTVTEKKAYFEAHFKKKALLRQTSSFTQDGTESQTHECNVLDRMDKCEENQSASNDNSHSVHFAENPDHSENREESHEIKFEGTDLSEVEPSSDYVICAEDSENQTSENETSNSVGDSIEIEYFNNGKGHFDHFDAESVSSGYHEKFVGMETKMKNAEFSHSEAHVALDSDNFECGTNSVLEDFENVVAPKTENGIDQYLLVTAAEPDLDLKQNLKEELVEDDNISEAADVLCKSQSAETNDIISIDHHQDLSPKRKASEELKISKPTVKNQANVTQIHGRKSSEVSKDSAKITSKRETGGLLKGRTGSISINVPTSAARSLCSTIKAAESESSKVKLLHGNKCEKEARMKKAVVPRPATPEKFESRERQIINRSKHIVNTSNQGMRQHGAALAKRDELPERRKKESESLKEKSLHRNRSEKDYMANKAVAPRPSTPQKSESQRRHGSNSQKDFIAKKGVAPPPSTPQKFERREHHRSNSEKEFMAKKVVAPRPSTEKFEPQRHDLNRPKQAVNLTNSDMRRSTSAFNFRSDERAERRKEYHAKLEEKMHAKEEELNQIHAMAQEQTEAEIKQFRRSLNFKATLMPPFYQGAALHGLRHEKAMHANTKSTKPLCRSSSLWSKSTRAVVSCRRKSDNQGPPARDSVSNGDPETGAYRPSTPTNRSCSSKAGTRNPVTGKEHRNKLACSQRHGKVIRARPGN